MKQLYGALLRFCEKHMAAGELLRGIKNTILRLRFVLWTAGCRVDEKTVIFCAFEGRSYSDSPKAIFEYMVRCGEYADYTFVWAFSGACAAHRARIGERVKELTGSLAGKAAASGTDCTDLSAAASAESAGRVPKVVVTAYGTAAFYRYLACAKYWVLNYKVKDYIRPKKNQIFVQCWHGTPLKRLGYDLTHFDNPMNTAAGNAKHYGIEVKKFSYFLSPSPYATEKFRSAWRMEDFGKGDIIVEEGYPRNDVLADYVNLYVGGGSAEDKGASSAGKLPAYRKEAFRRIDAHAKKRRRKVILYAPTYRQEDYETGRGYTSQVHMDLDFLRAELGDDFLILYRAHYFIADRIDFSKYKGFVIDASRVDDVNDLLLISDILITDYSSVLFDYAILKRPMIFYMYDLEYYRDVSNGFYFDPEQVLPGPIVRSDEELIDAVKKAASGFEYDETYQRFNETFNPHEDGCACERTVRRIFE